MENHMIPFEINGTAGNIIKVIGVGGGGSNAVNHMFRQGVKGVDFIVCNTDSQALDISPVPFKVQLGSTLTQGRGAGSIPEVGKNAAIESINDIKEFLSKETKMVFITAGMGGGTGTGAAPIIAAAAKELGILTVGIVTIPFMFEGKKRKMQADNGIEQLKQSVDTLIIICNDKLREIYGNLRLTEAFGHADDVVTTAAKGISDIITTTLHINTDFADIETVLRESGVAIMGSAMSSGENKAIDAIESAMNSPLLNDNNITGARYVLLNITSGYPEITMDELNDITEYVQNAAGQSADVIHGYGVDPELGDAVKVTIIATGFSTNKIPSDMQAAKPNRIVRALDEQAPVSTSTATPQANIPSEPIPQQIYHKEPQMEVYPEAVAAIPPSLENIPNATIEVEFEVSSNLDPSLMPYLKTSDGVSSVAEKENDLLKEEDRNAQERINRLRQFNYRQKITQGNMSDLDNIPAYIRKNKVLSDVPHSSESVVSKYTLSEGEDGKGELRQNNSFLHDNVD
jgi:cell division protein FtsZ